MPQIELFSSSLAERYVGLERREMPQIEFFSAGKENQALGPGLNEILIRVLGEGDMLNGEDVERLERSIARIAKRRHAIAVSSGTDALFFALTALGLGPGDEVLVPAFSFVASASAIVRTGAKPVFVDVGLESGSAQQAPFTLCLERAEAAITPLTRAMVWVGLFGGLSDPRVIEQFAERQGILLVEDAAQSFGAYFGGYHAGGMGSAASFSFDRNKVLGAPGTAGAVVTDDDQVAQRARALRWHGITAGRVERLGYNSQLSNLSAAILNLKLEQLPTWLDRRRAVAARYDKGFARLPLLIPQWPSEVVHARHKYVLLSDRREQLIQHLASRGVPTRRHYDRALSCEPLLMRMSEGISVPNSEKVAEQAFSLPIHPFLDENATEHVVDAVAEFFE